MIAPKEVLYEIKQKDDQLAIWCKKQSKCFMDPSQRQIEIIKGLLREFPSFVKEDGKYDADTWVIALAIEMTSSTQMTLTPVKRVVITEERIKGEKVKIPFVCQERSINTLDILGMVRTEQWKF